MEFSKKELNHVILAVLLLTFIFGFNDGNETFQAGEYFKNILVVFLSVCVIFGTYFITQKIVAKKYSIVITFSLWCIQRFYINRGKAIEKSKLKNLYIGPIISFFVTFISRGTFFLPLVASFQESEKRHYRAGRQYVHMEGFEEAKIALSGILAIVLLVMFTSLLNQNGMFDQFIKICVYFASFQLLPLPRLEGGRIFFNSIPLYIFATIFIGVTFVLAIYLNVIYSILIALLLAMIIVFIYFYKYKKY
ncbi:MAG: hypothetical protein AABW49_03900 [Nanoarchaeota archaeon]